MTCKYKFEIDNEGNPYWVVPTVKYTGIGTKKEIILNRFLNDAREVFEPQDTGRKQFCAIIVEISDITHKVTKVDRINVIE